MTELTRRTLLVGGAAATAATALGAHSAISPAAANAPCPTISIKDFLAAAEAQALSNDERGMIVNQGIELLKSFYAHLPIKRVMYGADPLERLRLLQQRLPWLNSDRQFHAEMLGTFASLHDMHTVYQLPQPYAMAHAWLPFKVESCVEGGQRKYIVSRVADDFTHATFQPGVEVRYWNGVPIARAAQLAGGEGANPGARHALGLARLTYRHLRWQLPPEEEFAIVRYLAGGQELDISIPWNVSTNPDRSGLCDVDPTGTCTEVEQIQKFRKFLYRPYDFCHQFSDEDPELISTPDGDFGYIRIFTFERKVSDDQFVADFRAKVDRLAGSVKGLIVDVRDNGGGATRASERIVQFVAPTPGTIDPIRLYFVATPVTLQLCKLGAPVQGLGPNGLTTWIPSIERALQAGAPFSDSFEYTSKSACNVADRRVFPHPVIVVTSALTYSAGEYFVAGFQDHGGMILSVDETTGGGGAGVRQDFELSQFFVDANQTSPLRDLPKDAGFKVAFRRAMRSGLSTGRDFEDIGIARNKSYAMTRNDLLNNNQDLKKEAIRLLLQMPSPT